MSHSRTSWREIGTIVGLALLITAWFTFPLWLQPGRWGRFDTGDGQFSIWNVAWVTHALASPRDDLANANIFYPASDALFFSEPNLGAGLLALPFYCVTKDGLVAYNAAVFLGFVLAFVSTALLIRYLTGDIPAAVIGAVLISFCPYVLGHTAHIQLLMIWPLPLGLLALHAFVRRQTPITSLCLGGSVGLAALFCAYYAVLAAGLVTGGVLFYAASRGRWRGWRYWGYAVLAGSTAVGLCLALFQPYLRLRRAGFARGVEEAFQHAALWQSYLTSGSTVHYSILPEVWDWRETLFPGFIAIGFGVLGIGWTLWRRARIGSLTAKPDGMAETVGYYSLVAVGSLWVSLGPQGGLYQWLYDAVPLFHFLRAPGRFGFGVTLSLSVIAALTLAHGLAGHRRRRLYLAAVAILAIGELTTEIPFQPAPVPDAAVVALSRLPRGPVVELPFWQSGRSLTRHTEYMYRSIHHWHPLVNGYSDYFPPGFFDVGVRLESFPSPEAFEAMDANAVRYVVVHLEHYADDDKANLLTDPRIRERLTMLVRTNAVVLYEVRSPGRIVP